jgi:heme exporter protein A
MPQVDRAAVPEPDGSRPLLSLSGVGKHFGRVTALRDVSLEVQRGQRWAIFGRNGAGKTTLLCVAAGLVRPSAGKVSFLGEAVGTENRCLRRQMGYLSHATSLYEGLTAQENLLYYARLFHVEQPQARALELLAEVELEEWKDAPVRGFSRGMQQRLAIARAFLHRPQLLLFDEPYTGLDVPAARLLERLIAREAGLTILITSHDLERGLALATHAAVLHRGRLVFREAVDTSEGGTTRAAYRRWVEGEGIEPSC